MDAAAFGLGPYPEMLRLGQVRIGLMRRFHGDEGVVWPCVTITGHFACLSTPLSENAFSFSRASFSPDAPITHSTYGRTAGRLANPEMATRRMKSILGPRAIDA